MPRKGETLQGQDLPRLRLRQRGPVHRREGHPARRQGRHRLRLDGFIYDADGIDREKLAFVMELKNVKRGRITEYAEKYPEAVYTPIDPRRTQPPVGHQGRLRLPLRHPERDQRRRRRRTCSQNGCMLVAEGANMPCDAGGGTRVHRAPEILYAPGKAANAGGVATSGLEMSPEHHAPVLDAARRSTQRLHGIMKSTSTAPASTPPRSIGTPGNYVIGANIAGFMKVADAMIAQGLV